MTTHRICHALLIAVVFLVVTPAFSTENGSFPSSNPAEAEARNLIQQGRFIEALTILRPLARVFSDNVSILFLVGLAATEASRMLDVSEKERHALLEEAIESLHSILINHPGLVRVRLDLARAFFFKEEDSLARQHFERVLVGNPLPAVVANVQRFLAEIRSRRRWDMHFGFALAPDSNIGATSTERIIYIHGLPFRRNEASLTRSGIGVSVWIGGEYQYPLSNRMWLRAGANISRREYSGVKFDRLSFSGRTGPRWMVGENTEISLLASARQGWTGEAPDYYDLGVRVEGAHRLNSRLTVNGRTSWHQRRYRTRTALNGPTSEISLSGTWLVTPTIRAEVSVGYEREHPKLQRWQSTSRWLLAGVSVILPRGFTLGANGQLRLTTYQGNWFPYTLDGAPRDDRTRSLRFTVQHRSFTIGGFSPQLALVHELRDTNAQLYDYKRTAGELSFVRQF